MNPQKAIFVPGHAVPEAIRSIRFIPGLDPVDPSDTTRTIPAENPVTLEVWRGDLYGEPTIEQLTTFSTSDRTATVYADHEMPVVEPGKSAVAILHDPPSRWEVEFQSELIDLYGRSTKRTVILDNYGTSRETFCELKASAHFGSVAGRWNSDVRRTNSVARSLGRLVGRLTISISRVLRRAPSARKVVARPTTAVDGVGFNCPAVQTRSFAPESPDDSEA